MNELKVKIFLTSEEVNALIEDHVRSKVLDSYGFQTKTIEINYDCEYEQYVVDIYGYIGERKDNGDE